MEAEQITLQHMMVEIEDSVLLLYRVCKTIPKEEYMILVDEYLRSKLRPYLEIKLKEYRMITNEQLDNWFTYHAPTDEQIKKYKLIRDYGRTFAEIIRDNTPPSADQTAAIRKIREAVMTANAAIACEE